MRCKTPLRGAGCLLAVLLISVAVSADPIRLPLVEPRPGEPPDPAYTQDFNSLASTPNGGTKTWTNDSTIPGWFSSTTSYRVSSGSNTVVGLLSNGSVNDTDRALGSKPASSTGTIRYGAQFQNKTGRNIAQLQITFTGEQWADDNAATQKLEFFFGASATSVDSGGYTLINDLSFSSLRNDGSGPLDGNAQPNRQKKSYTIETSIPRNAIFWIRWQDSDDQGLDHGLAIDDLSLVLGLNPLPLPEPSILGLGCIGAMGFLHHWRRWKKVLEAR